MAIALIKPRIKSILERLQRFVVHSPPPGKTLTSKSLTCSRSLGIKVLWLWLAGITILSLLILAGYTYTTLQTPSTPNIAILGQQAQLQQMRLAMHADILTMARLNVQPTSRKEIEAVYRDFSQHLIALNQAFSNIETHAHSTPSQRYLLNKVKPALSTYNTQAYKMLAALDNNKAAKPVNKTGRTQTNQRTNKERIVNEKDKSNWRNYMLMFTKLDDSLQQLDSELTSNLTNKQMELQTARQSQFLTLLGMVTLVIALLLTIVVWYTRRWLKELRKIYAQLPAREYDPLWYTASSIEPSTAEPSAAKPATSPTLRPTIWQAVIPSGYVSLAADSSASSIAPSITNTQLSLPEAILETRLDRGDLAFMALQERIAQEKSQDLDLINQNLLENTVLYSPPKTRTV